MITSFLAEYKKYQKSIQNEHQKKINTENCDDEITSQNSDHHQKKFKTEIIENDIYIETATHAKYAENFSEKIENGQPKYECNLCQHTGKSKNGLIHHIRTRHLGIRFECSECADIYSECILFTF